MLRGLITRNRSQKGFMLIQLIVAIAIASVIGVGIAISVFHVINVNALSTNHVSAVKQVESAVFWINRDALMSQIIQPGGGSGFPLTLSWIDWDNTVHQVCYTLENGQFQRSHSVNGEEASRTVIAENINSNPGKTSCQFAFGVFNLKVTASVSGFRPASETRTAQVIPRPAR